MPSLTVAQDDTYARFVESLATNAPAVLGYVPEVRYQGKEDKLKPANDKFYVEVSFFPMVSGQTAFCGVAQKRYKDEGMAQFMIHCPKKGANAFRLGGLLAEKLRDSFRSWHSPNGVWYRRERILSGEPEDSFWIKILTVDFHSQEVS